MSEDNFKAALSPALSLAPQPLDRLRNEHPAKSPWFITHIPEILFELPGNSDIFRHHVTVPETAFQKCFFPVSNADSGHGHDLAQDALCALDQRDDARIFAELDPA